MNHNPNSFVIDGRYQLIELIGQDGMGSVYQALEIRTCVVGRGTGTKRWLKSPIEVVRK